MTVSTQTNIVVYTGDDVADTFDFTFPVYDATHFAIYRQVIATGLIDKTYNTSEYTVTGIDEEDGGSITIIAGPIASTHRLIITRQVPYTQDLDVQNEGGFYANNFEVQLDLLEMQVQQLREQVNRSVKGFIGETFDDLPGAAGRENKFVGFDSAGLLGLFDDTGSASTFTLDNVLRVPESIPEIANAAARANKFLKFDGSGDPTVAVGSATLADGTYNDIEVSGSGTAMDIKAGKVGTTELADDAATYAKIQNVSATDKLLGRTTAGAGNIEEITFPDFFQGLLTGGSSAGAVLTALGMSSFFQTLIDETTGGAVLGLLGTPAGSIKAGSLAANGYVVFDTTALLGADLMIQWGSDSAAADSADTVTFPQAFSAVVWGIASGGSANASHEGDVHMTAVTTTQMTVMNSNGSATCSYWWLAIGDKS